MLPTVLFRLMSSGRMLQEVVNVFCRPLKRDPKNVVPSSQICTPDPHAKFEVGGGDEVPKLFSEPKDVLHKPSAQNLTRKPQT